MKKFVLLLFLAFPFLLFAQQSFEIPFDQLKEAKYPTEDVFGWNNKIIVQRSHYYVSDPNYPKYYFLDEETETLKPLVILNYDSVMALAENSSTLFALVRWDTISILLMQDKKVPNKWVADTVPESSNINDYVNMFVTGEKILILEYDYWMRNLSSSKWIHEEYGGFEGMAQLVDNSLYGLMLSCKPWLGPKISRFDIKLGKLVEKDEDFDIPDDVPIRVFFIESTASDAKGNLWLTQGVHRNSPQGGYVYDSQDSLKHKDPDEPLFYNKERPRIYSYDGKRFKPYYWFEAIPQPMKGGESHSGATVDCLTIDDNDDLYFTVQFYGIFRIRNSKVENVINGQLVPPRGSELYQSEPEGMHVAPNGDIYIAYNDLGLCVFLQEKSSYTFKQYLFDK